MNLTQTHQSKEITRQVRQFIDNEVIPLELEILKQTHTDHADWSTWQKHPKLESLKSKAKAAGLWNLFLPEHDQGLSNLAYAPVAEEMGRSLLAPELFNCNAPDTGNMEIIWKYGTESQKEKWLKPLLEGVIRSAFCMTEPDIASSDAANIRASIVQHGDKIILNGTKWWSTGLGHPDCKVLVFMGISNPDADRHQRHSMVLVPIDTPGVKIERMLPVFGNYDAPYGHGQVSFDQVSLPTDCILAGLGKGYEIAQGRLGPGRVHHAMRLIGAAARAYELMVERGISRIAFGQPLIKLGGNPDIIAFAAMKIEMARLLTLKTAWLLDHQGIENALSEVSQIKVMAPQVACEVIDQAIQIFGGMGLSDDTPLASMYAYARIMRLADGPDEVHLKQIARYEIAKVFKHTP